MSIAVALTSGGPSDQTISAQYCTPAGRATAIDILIPRATYNHLCWDWPVDPSLYNITGDAVLAYGRPPAQPDGTLEGWGRAQA